jgi:hypothetical protein
MPDRRRDDDDDKKDYEVEGAITHGCGNGSVATFLSRAPMSK